VALVIGVVFAAVQFGLGPWFMDLSLRWFYRFNWVKPDELPEHLRLFVERVCEKEGMKFPSFGLIDDGAPTAFTYGHVPNNARIVISRGILELLEPEEVEGVVAHEMGHAHNWDMALMTLAQLVPLLLYFIYRVGIRLSAGRGRSKEFSWAVAIGAYVLYIVAEYIVLWFSRTREYFADRFAGRVTKNPNALAMALVKIAYGLAAQPRQKVVEENVKGKKKVKTEERVVVGQGAMRALNIFDERAAVSLVVASAVGRGTDAKHPDVEHIKSAMQWDLWNPWAKLYELNSTHPLVANRLTYLADQAAHLGQEPLVVFDRRKPESYWDDFFVDLFMMLLPWLGLLLGSGALVGAWALEGWDGNPTRWLMATAGAGLAAAGLGSLLKTNFSYRRDFFPHLSVAALMHRVKVSGVRPVPATLTGNIIGKGVPGLIWSKDFVVRDPTGILFLDYQQPLEIWNFLFGLLRAERYQGKEVRVSGWFRRAPVPYMEVYRIETTDGSQPPRRCYSMHARLIVAGVLFVAGVAVTALGVMM
jgi:Zn-dependent protease with chaperone function